MRNIPMNVTSLKNLPECWLYTNERYIHYPVSRDFNLPFMSLEHEQLLKELEIDYQKVPDISGKLILEVFDAANYEEYDLTLPVYINVCNCFKYAKKYTGKVPTADSLQSARIVMKKIGEINTKKKTINFLKKKLAGSKAVLVSTSSLFVTNEDLIWNDDHLKVLPVINSYNHLPSPYSIVLDVNKIELNDSISISVPKKIRGLVIGKNGWQVRNWCKKLGLKGINVVDI